MPEDIKVDKDKFDRILKRMVDAKPLTKAEISARIKADRDAKKLTAFGKRKQRKKSSE